MSKAKNKSKSHTSELPLVAHLVELRDRLIRAIVGVLVIFVALISFANDLYTLLATPLMAHLPEGASMIATEVASPFLTPFKLTLVLSIFLSMPWLLFQFWAFIAPGLYEHEQKMMFPILASSTLLFYLGAAFAYFVVFPVVFGFFTSVAPEGVSVMTDISKYLDFVLKMFFAFGLAFEVPIATIILVWMGITTPQALASKRPYIIVIAFVFGMLLTPPDVISQTLLAVPMILLFELGLFFSKMFVRKRTEREAAEEAEQQQPIKSSETDSADENGTASEHAEEWSESEFDKAFDEAEADERALDQEQSQNPPADDEQKPSKS